jgi:hypothetical protein
MPYRIARIDVHKKTLAIAVADVEVEGDVHFERLKVGTSPVQLRALAEWPVEREVEEVVMESTAQYSRPCGSRSSGTGDRNAGRAPMRALYPARCTWHKRNRIEAPAGESETFPMLSVW